MTRFIVGLVCATTVAAAAISRDADQSPATPPPASGPDRPTLVGAGDIANCQILGGAEATARLLDTIGGTVFTAGDHAYDIGTSKQFEDCYAPTWGRHKARTRPTPGNHDYLTKQGAPYYAYFGENAGPDGRGYYSYDLGSWHVISLNSNIDARKNSPQLKWLRDDLQANPSVCALAYWHIPVFSSGPHGSSGLMQDAWKVLYEFGVDVVINGHDHDYERFAPQDPNGKPAPDRGIREFVVGTGGGGTYRFGPIRANSEVRNNKTYGVLKLTLDATSYEWEYIPVAGQTFQDAGTALCVSPDGLHTSQKKRV